MITYIVIGLVAVGIGYVVGYLQGYDKGWNVGFTAAENILRPDSAGKGLP